ETGGVSVALVHERSAALRYRGLLAADSTGRELPARIVVREDALLLRVDDVGARYPIVIDPFVQKAKLVIANPEGNDHFGVAVAISGDPIVVGANRPPQPTAPPASAYVFVKPSSGWS